MLYLKPGSLDLVVHEARVREALPGPGAQAVEREPLDLRGQLAVVASPAAPPSIVVMFFVT